MGLPRGTYFMYDQETCQKWAVRANARRGLELGGEFTDDAGQHGLYS